MMSPPLRLITFDVTGTLLKFRKPPVQQYLEIGARYGVTADEETMKKAFKQQWKEMNETQPNYGTCWRSWWTTFVVRTFQNAKAEGSADEGTLRLVASDLIEHFTTDKCWEPKEGAVDLLLALKQLGSESRTAAADLNGNNGKKFKSIGDPTCTSAMQIGVVSNFDSRLEQILRATQLHHFFHFFSISHECQVSKPDETIFKAALTAAAMKNQQHPLVQPAQALHIGDSYTLDYVGAVNAGWNAMLVMSSPDQQRDLPEHVRSANPPLVFSDLIQLKSHLLQRITPPL